MRNILRGVFLNPQSNIERSEDKLDFVLGQRRIFQQSVFHYHSKPLDASRKQPLTDIQHQGTKHLCFVLEKDLEMRYNTFVTEGGDIALLLRESPPKDALMCFIRYNTGNLIEFTQILTF